MKFWTVFETGPDGQVFLRRTIIWIQEPHARIKPVQLLSPSRKKVSIFYKKMRLSEATPVYLLMSEQIETIHHLEEVYGPRPLLREAAQILDKTISLPEKKVSGEANERLAAPLIACS